MDSKIERKLDDISNVLEAEKPANDVYIMNSERSFGPDQNF